MNMTIILFPILLATFITWYKEPRIFLFLFYKIVFRYRTGKPLHIDKQLNFPESSLLESNWKEIYAELEQFRNENKALPKFHQVDKSNYKISFDNGPAWRTIVLKAYDGYFAHNCKQFPKTVALLKDIDCISTAMFSILEPHVHIPPHTGKLSGLWRYHLALSVPTSPECFIIIHEEKYNWKQGEGILFNDTYLHSVANNTEEYRIVLFLDIKKHTAGILHWISELILYLINISPMFKRALKTGTIKVD